MNRQYNDQKKNDKLKTNDLQNTAQKTKDWWGLAVYPQVDNTATLIISPREKVGGRAHKTSLIPLFDLKCLYHTRKVYGHALSKVNVRFINENKMKNKNKTILERQKKCFPQQEGH
jgi:hypothetical protein